MLLAQFETHEGGQIAVNPMHITMVAPGISRDRTTIRVNEHRLIVRGEYQAVVNKIDQMLIRNEP